MVTYAWGRPGIGSRELARALLFDATGSAALAERFCRDLTHEVVACLSDEPKKLTRRLALRWGAWARGGTGVDARALRGQAEEQPV
jgi:hypothetical protein